MAKKRDLGKETYFTVFNSDMKLIKDPVKKILFSKIKNWIYRNEDIDSTYHFKANHWWTFGTYDYWAEECGLETKTVGNHLRELVLSGLLKTGNYNKLKIDKTIWYRLASVDEMENINFRLLFYGKSKEKNEDNHSNDTLFRMYQNGMSEVKNLDIEKEKSESPLLEYNQEYKPHNNSEQILEYNTNYIKENISYCDVENKKNILEDYYKIFEDNDIVNHIILLSKFNVEDIPEETIKHFLDKFHEKKIDSIINEEGLFTYKCRIDGMFEQKLNSKQLQFIGDLATKYFKVIIFSQPAEQKIEEVSSINASSPRIPLNPSSPNY